MADARDLPDLSSTQLLTSAECISDARREFLRRYRLIREMGGDPGEVWRGAAREALLSSGGQMERLSRSLHDYDHHRYGPFLGISNEGSGAATICAAALASPKARALNDGADALTIGVAVDGEVLGGVGEVPIGPDEYADIWLECAGRALMSTNIGSRANMRFYKPAPIVPMDPTGGAPALEAAKAGLAAAFKPFLEAPGGPRPLVVFVELPAAAPAASAQQALEALQAYVETGAVAAPAVQTIGLKVSLSAGEDALPLALAGVDLAAAAGLREVAIDGPVRPEAGRVLSLPGLLTFLPPDSVDALLERAAQRGVRVRPFSTIDADTVARQIWATLNTARSMGLHLGKYGLFPLTLDECDRVVGHMQRWFPDWSAAPVFYVDQGLLADDHAYTIADLEPAIERWLRLVAGHGVRLVLIDTVDKAQGWKIVKADGDPKGLLEIGQIARLNALAESLGVNAMWAGGIGIDQAWPLGELGVFGVYVTTAVAEAAPVSGIYVSDPALAAVKRPTRAGILRVKTLLEAGFLSKKLEQAPQTAEVADARTKLAAAGRDAAALAPVLIGAWRAYWQTLA